MSVWTGACVRISLLLLVVCAPGLAGAEAARLDPARELAPYYRVLPLGSERWAGHTVQRLQLQALDHWRFGYAVWTEQQSGVVLRWQMRDAQGRVLAQMTGSEVRAGVARVLEGLALWPGARAVSPGGTVLAPVQVGSEGWVLKNPVPGFMSVRCAHRRIGTGAGLQWVFSDGVAMVSVFVERFDPSVHADASVQVLGGTHTLRRRKGLWQLSAVGEVPLHTLEAFLQGLERDG